MGPQPTLDWLVQAVPEKSSCNQRSRYCNAQQIIAQSRCDAGWRNTTQERQIYLDVPHLQKLAWRCCCNVSPSHGKNEALGRAFLQSAWVVRNVGHARQRVYPATHGPLTHRLRCLASPSSGEVRFSRTAALLGDSEGKLVIVSTSTSRTALTNPTYFERDRLIDPPIRIGAVGGFAILLQADQADRLSLFFDGTLFRPRFSTLSTRALPTNGSSRVPSTTSLRFVMQPSLPHPRRQSSPTRALCSCKGWRTIRELSALSSCRYQQWRKRQRKLPCHHAASAWRSSSSSLLPRFHSPGTYLTSVT